MPKTRKVVARRTRKYALQLQQRGIGGGYYLELHEIEDDLNGITLVMTRQEVLMLGLLF